MSQQNPLESSSSEKYIVVPFVGLIPYSEADKKIFFGRTKETQIIADSLEVCRLTILYSRSGTGKSSVLRAGVADYLKKRALKNAERDGKRRFAVIVYPALTFKDKWQKPLDDLIEQIREILREINPDLRLSELGASVLKKISTIFTASIREISPEIEVSKIGKILRNVLKEISFDSELSDIKKVIDLKIRELEPDFRLSESKSWFFETLQAYMAILKEEAGVYELYVILDQFEEYFGVYPQRNEFDNEFVRVVNNRDIGVHFLISIRSEWITKLNRYKGQILDLFDRQIELNPFNKESGKQVIEEPIKEFFKQLALEKVSVPEGEVISGELVDRILNEVKDEVQAGCISLPYLQLVMKELWASICDLDGCPYSNSINMKDYEKLGEECDSSFPESKNLNTIAEKIACRYWNNQVNQFDFMDKLRTAIVFHYLPSASGCGIFYDIANLAKRSNEYREDYFIPLPDPLSEGEVRRLLEKLKDFRIVNALPGSQYEFFLSSLGKAAYYWQENQHKIFDRHWQIREEVKNQQERERSKEEDKEWQKEIRKLLAISSQAKHEGDYTESQRSALNAYELNQKKLDSDTLFVAPVDEILREALSRNTCYSFCNRLLYTHEKDVAAVAVSQDGKWFATGGYDGIVNIWHLDNDVPFLNLESQQGRVNCLAFNPTDHKILAVGTHQGIVELLDWSKPEAETLRRITIPVLQQYECDDLLLFVLYMYAKRISIPDKYAFYLWDKWYGQRIKERDPEVRSVAFTPDGSLLASASWNRTVRVWDVSQPEKPKLVRILPESEDKPDSCRDWFWSVAFSGDGRWLAAGCRNGTVWLWEKDEDGNGDYFSKQPIILPIHPETNWKDFEPSFLHRREVLTVAFSRDGDILAAGGRDKKVRLWKMSQVGVPGVRPQVLGGHKNMVRTISFSPDGQFLASGDEDKKLRLWELNSLETNSSSIVLNAPGNKFRLGVSSVAFSPDSQFLIAGSWDGGVRLWKKSPPPPLSVRVLGRHNNSVRALAFSPDGQWLVSGSFDGTLRLWNWQVLGDESQTLPGQLGEVRTVAFSPDGRLLASGGRDGVIRFWDVLKMKKELRFESSKPNEENKTEVLSLAFCPSSKTWYLASVHSAEKNKPIKLWKFDNLNIATPKTPQEIVPDTLLEHESLEGGEEGGELRTLAFSPDGRWLASGGSDGIVGLFDCQQFPPKSTKKIFVEEEVREVAFSPKSQMMAIVTEDGMVQLWNLLPLPDEEPSFISYLVGNSVAFNPDPNEMMLATGSNSGTIGLWNLSRIDAFPLLLNSHQGMIRTLAFSPDGEFLASGGDDNTIRLWIVKTQRLAEEVSNLLGQPLPCSGEKAGDSQKEKLKEDFNSRKKLLSSGVFSKEGELLERVTKLIQERESEPKDIAEEDVANISDIFDQCQEERYGEAFCLLEDLVQLDFLVKTRDEGFRRMHYGLSPKYRQYLELVTSPSALPSLPPLSDSPPAPSP